MTHYLYGQDARPELSRPYQAILCEPVQIIEANMNRLIQKWTELYLMTFGRKAFFSEERVRRIFGDMAGIFVSSLKTSNFDFYFASLRDKGKLFSKLGVPFEEIILCLQLYEEAYLSILLEDRQLLQVNTKDILMAFEEFNNISTAIFAVSYFRSVKSTWQKNCKGYQEENDRLRVDIQSLQEEFFTSTRNELNSMELLLSGINRKLRKSVVQSRRIQKFADALEKEPNLKNLLKIADKYLKQILPQGSQICFGLFDENQRKFSIYGASRDFQKDEPPPGFGEEVFFSELPLQYQETLFNDFKPQVIVKDAKLLPAFLADSGEYQRCSDFLFLPIRKYRDTMGFMLLATTEANVFTRNAAKYYVRLSRILSGAIFSNIYFSRHKKHGNFISMLHEIEDRVLQRHSLETTLDYCLGALIDLLDVERASLMLMDKKKKLLSLYAAKGYRVYPFSGLTLKSGEGIAGWSLKESKIISIPRMKDTKSNGTGNRGLHDPHEKIQLSVRSLLCVPLVSANEPLGVINLSTITYYKNFEQSEIDMINQFSQRIAQALKSLATMRDLEVYMARAPRRG